MRPCLVTVLAVLLIIGTGCGRETDDTDRSTAPSADRTLTTDGTNGRAEQSPAPIPTHLTDIEPGPSDAYFVLDRVLDVNIEIAPEDWDALRHQSRKPGETSAWLMENLFSQPIPKVYTWFSATVTVDGETLENVGIRKKGFVGSRSDSKPSLKFHFDKYVDDQYLGGVMERMMLNNSIQDASKINTCLSYWTYAAAGHAAPRCNFATVSVNGTKLGLYIHVEEIKDPFLQRHFESAEGNLYEGTISDFTPKYRGTIEKKNNEDVDDWSDIDAVVEALQDPSGTGLEKLARIVDLDRYLSYWALEVLTWSVDGYSANRNNFYFYREPDGAFVFIPWGADQAFRYYNSFSLFDDDPSPPSSVIAKAAIPNRLYNDPDWRLKYVATLRNILDTVWDEDTLLATVDKMAVIVQQHSLQELKKAAADDAERVRQFILTRRDDILADLIPTPPDWPSRFIDPLNCPVLYGFGDEPVPVATTLDGQTVLATVKWKYNAYWYFCYLVLDDAAIETLRANPPQTKPQQPSAADAMAAAKCRNAFSPHNEFADEPVPVAKTGDGQVVLATVKWDYNAEDNACNLILDEAARQALLLAGSLNGRVGPSP